MTTAVKLADGSYAESGYSEDIRSDKLTVNVSATGLLPHDRLVEPHPVTCTATVHSGVPREDALRGPAMILVDARTGEAIGGVGAGSEVSCRRVCPSGHVAGHPAVFTPDRGFAPTACIAALMYPWA